MATMKEVAKKANVSVATVSRVLNKNGYVKASTREKIESAIQELEYYPNEVARTLFKKTSKTIGLLLPDMSNPFFTLVAKGVEDAALEKGYNIIIGNGEMNEEKELNYLTTFKANHCCGVIASQLSTQFAFDLFTSYQLPYTLIDRVIEHDNCIEADHFKGGQLQAKKIIDGRASHVLLLHQDLNYKSFDDRFKGALSFLTDHDIDVVTQDELSLDSKQFEKLIHEHQIDSIICSNDVSAFKVMKWLHDLHITIPETVQVIGYDDIRLAALYQPALTTIRQPAYEIGQQATYMLINQLEDKAYASHVTLNVEVIERASTRRKK